MPGNSPKVRDTRSKSKFKEIRAHRHVHNFLVQGENSDKFWVKMTSISQIMLLTLVLLVIFLLSVSGFSLWTAGTRLTRGSCVQPSSSCSSTTRVWNNAESGGIFEDDDDGTFKRIVDNFLMSKFKDCQGDDCRMFLDRKEVADLLTGLLPPVTSSELETEVAVMMKLLGAEKADDLVDADKFLEVLPGNSYWSKAGPLVVKELMYLDALFDYYYTKKEPKTLNDEDYSDLKEMLTWEGSNTATMTGREALFVTAVVASKRGKSIIPDDEYNTLKAELLAKSSWVVTDKTDKMSKLGMNTMLGYLYKSH